MVFIGAHISRQKTFSETINKIIENNGNALQIFASNPRGSKITELNKQFFDIDETKRIINKKKFSIIIHNPYTINIAMPFMINKRSIDIKDCYWIQLIIHELKIADLINSYGCIIHCGKYTLNLPDSALIIMKQTLDYIIDQIKNLNLKSKIILETSSGQGTELLSNYEDFLNFYNLFNEDQKKYIKICIDTCHVWAAGYELVDIYQITKKNKNLKDIAVIHINNSKNPKNSNLDRHDELTKGYINIDHIITFIKTMKKNNKNLILILETPNENNLIEEFKLIKN